MALLEQHTSCDKRNRQKRHWMCERTDKTATVLFTNPFYDSDKMWIDNFGELKQLSGEF